MPICVGKNTYGNFIICLIEFILINDDCSYVYFIGKTKELIHIPELGVYETFDNGEEANRSQWYDVFPHNYLLFPDPFLKTEIMAHTVYLMKYQPFDPQK